MTEPRTILTDADLPVWRRRPEHRAWLMRQGNAILDFAQQASIDPRGGFFELDADGRPMPGARQIHTTTRMVHCFVIAALLGRPGAADVIDHGLTYLWSGHRDESHGGYMWSLQDGQPADDSKQAYGHGFVLLAAAGGKLVGHPLADRLFADVAEVLDRRFWEENHGAFAEEFARDWSPIGGYRGQNSNMHLTEALMAAFEASGEGLFLSRAERVAELVIGRHAAGNGWRLPEHFHADWEIDRAYRGADMFRPYGTTPGHSLEWARLLLQLWVLGGRRHDWMVGAARALFACAVETSWDKAHGGFFYTLDWDDTPRNTAKLWWPAAEGIAAAAFLGEHDPSAFHEDWYRRIWNFTDRHFIDHRRGGWFPELDETLNPAQTLFAGKPDVYHSLQACLIPLYPATGSLTAEIIRAQRDG
ncbi:AGE family epimerase/isomerase [Methylobrevis pamukkalensis]|uniref:Putative sugar isomerase YihS n=1 Tax=Methylobrevis pamukkalensis TaxID=1439726 RepID=A0A1E3H3G5_9HYPH|nr:AGE family epimerase/isomerase [Methylobrevis pamukkalensis]ODN70887.1 putative sugar isomerase YihS [Methylobrevis pamukkalensis]